MVWSRRERAPRRSAADRQSAAGLPPRRPAPAPAPAPAPLGRDSHSASKAALRATLPDGPAELPEGAVSAVNSLRSTQNIYPRPRASGGGRPDEGCFPSGAADA